MVRSHYPSFRIPSSMRKLSEIFRKSLPFLTSLFLITSTILGAGELTFYGQTDKNPLTYQPGEEIVFTIRLLEDGQPCGGKTIRWTRSGDDGNTETGKTVSDTDEPLVIRTSIDLPGFVWIKTVVLDESGEPVSGEAHEFNGGAGTKLDRLMSFPEPDDFDEFWQRQKTRLAEVPLKATLTEVDSEAEGVKCYDLRVDCIGVPVSGYFCMPETAAEKSLPATLVLQGYGVDSAGKENRLGKSGLALCINAHGIENGREKSYYKELFNTTLRGYGFPASSNANPETSYWNGVALRVMRALEFLKSRPEWDGENLRVVGEARVDSSRYSARPLIKTSTCVNSTSPGFAIFRDPSNNNGTDPSSCRNGHLPSATTMESTTLSGSNAPSRSLPVWVTTSARPRGL